MSDAPDTSGGRWLNLALGILVIVLLVLVYGFVRGTLWPGVDPERDENPGQLISGIIQVEVRNACGVPGLAADTRGFLRRHGFDVVGVGDYDNFDEPRSFVIDRVGDPDAARKVAAVLGLPEDRVVSHPVPELYLDATIVLGKDYRQLEPFAR